MAKVPYRVISIAFCHIVDVQGGDWRRKRKVGDYRRYRQAGYRWAQHARSSHGRY
uniref:Uncharacterized protein n=1 Tax=Oryza sativa subsp. japonica TaxID=39947 RepID=Q8H2V3_ORYSJ|nr:hypothetical protein [Oryza sativa Japonica Group]BAD05407.1 hypothetical protein [Oryza sativa Japonica Group]